MAKKAVVEHATEPRANQQISISLTMAEWQRIANRLNAIRRHPASAYAGQYAAEVETILARATKRGVEVDG